MKPKRKLKSWVKIAMLLIPEVVIICLLFFVAVNLEKKNAEVTIEINTQTKECEVFYE